MAEGLTKKENIFIPEVVADQLMQELPERIALTGVAQIDYTLEGKPGDEITYVEQKFLGDAKDVNEGEAVGVVKYEHSTKKAKIKKARLAVEVTKEAILSSHVDLVENTVSAIIASVASKIESDLTTTALTTSNSVTADIKTLEGFKTALGSFKRGFKDVPITLYMHENDALALQIEAGKAFLLGSEIGATGAINGYRGRLLGVDIVTSTRLTEGTALLIKEGALRLSIKKAADVEVDKDILKDTLVVVGGAYYATHIFNEAGVIKITNG